MRWFLSIVAALLIAVVILLYIIALAEVFGWPPLVEGGQGGFLGGPATDVLFVEKFLIWVGVPVLLTCLALGGLVLWIWVEAEIQREDAPAGTQRMPFVILAAGVVVGAPVLAAIAIAAKVLPYVVLPMVALIGLVVGLFVLVPKIPAGWANVKAFFAYMRSGRLSWWDKGILYGFAAYLVLAVLSVVF